jgi:signal peptidase II
MRPHRRSIRLVQPRLQLKLVLSFLGLSALALALQFVLLVAVLAGLASEVSEDPSLVLSELPQHLLWILLLSFAVCLPLTFTVGVLVTHRIAGPLYRFERFLRAVAAGERPEDCRIRDGDELQEFCRLLNTATQPLRQPAPVASAPASDATTSSDPAAERMDEAA